MRKICKDQAAFLPPPVNYVIREETRMEPIYVTGHRNPDTDSIVAAISYAALRHACGDRA